MDRIFASSTSAGDWPGLCGPKTMASRPFFVLVWLMSEITRNISKYRLQAFWEYLEGYSMAFDMYPDYGLPRPEHQDVYRVVNDYFDVSDDFVRVVKSRGALAADDANGTITDGTQSRTSAPADRHKSN
jgi:hypothetical protein